MKYGITSLIIFGMFLLTFSFIFLQDLVHGEGYIEGWLDERIEMLGISELEPKEPKPEVLYSVRIELSQFGGKEITQISIDEKYPCYLQQDGTIKCEVIEPDKLTTLSLSNDITKGIPIIDYRKPEYEIVQEECDSKLISKEQGCVDGKINKTEFIGYETKYLDYNKEQEIELDIKQNGKVSIGFASNNFTITDFVYGSCYNCSIDTTVELSSSHADADEDILGWWQFTDDATDNSGNELDGSVDGATHVHEHYEFDGNDQILVDYDPVFDYINFSVSFWSYITKNEAKTFISKKGDSGFEWVIAYETNFEFKLQLWNASGDAFLCAFWNGCFTAADYLPNNKWIHHVLTVNMTEYTYYIDGNMIISEPFDGPILIDSGQGIYIGSGANANWITGSMDEVVIYNRSLSSAEATALYNKGLYRQQGNYTSAIFDAGETVDWRKLYPNMTEAVDWVNITFKTRELNYTKPDLSDESLVGMWALNDTDCTDYSINGNDGTAQAGLICGGQSNDTVFEGENATRFIKDSYQYISLTGTQPLNISNQSYTISLWVKLVTELKSGFFTSGFNWGGDKGIAFLVNTNRKPALFHGKTFINSDTFLTLNQWYHLGIVYNDSHAIFYTNGNANSPQAIPNKYADDLYIEIGSEGGNKINGSMAYVSIYNRSLSQDEIMTIGQWQACELDEAHTMCDITNPDSRFLQWEGNLQTQSAPSNATPILNSVNISWEDIEEEDTTPPTYSTNSTNSTYASSDIEHRLNWTGGLSGYIFSFCNGTWDGNSCFPWDVTTCDYTGMKSIKDQDNEPFGIFIKPNGAKMYMVGKENESVYEYDLSTPWTISTASYLQNFSVHNRTPDPTDLFFKPDGTKMYISDKNDYIFEYDLSIAWDITSSTYLQNLSISEQDSLPHGIHFKSDGTIMYMIGQTNSRVYQYDLSKAWNISNATYIQNVSVINENWFVDSVTLNTDGTKMIFLGAFTNDEFNQYDLSIPWNISSSVFQQSYDVSEEDNSARGFFFKSDGTEVYYVGTQNDKIYQYSLSGEQMLNNTWTEFPNGGINDWSNVTKHIDSTVGLNYAWCVYANDTSDNWNSTSCENPFYYTSTSEAPPEDTCNPDSPLIADHNYDCDNNCVETGTLDCDGYSITTSNKGSGSIIFEQNPVNCFGVTLGCTYITQKG